MSKPRIAAAVRIRAYDVVARAVGEGVAYGMTRAHKHNDAPSRDSIAEHIEREVTAALCEVLDFGDDNQWR